LSVFQLSLFRAEMCNCAEFQLPYHLTIWISNLYLSS